MEECLVHKKSFVDKGGLQEIVSSTIFRKHLEEEFSQCKLLELIFEPV